MDIVDIRQALNDGIPVIYTAHCQKRMSERNISRADIFHCICYGEIIENYPLVDSVTSDKSLPSCLILGFNAKNDALIHIVVGFNGHKILIISACYPDMEHWMEDMKTRRKK